MLGDDIQGVVTLLPTFPPDTCTQCVVTARCDNPAVGKE